MIHTTYSSNSNKLLKVVDVDVNKDAIEARQYLLAGGYECLWKGYSCVA